MCPSNHCALMEQRLSFKANPFLLLCGTTQSLRKKMLSDFVFNKNILIITSSVSAPPHVISFSPSEAHEDTFGLSKHRNIQIQDKSTDLYSPQCYPQYSHRQYCDFSANPHLLPLTLGALDPVCIHVSMY